ncbi:MAG TPA: RNA methyltransferase [Acidimicrobiia bacterium]|nr:RNA methyltransferase [Acidimicrobiia bacterium]
MARAGIGDSVEGIHAVAAALAAGRVTKLVVERRRVEGLGDLLDAADRSSVRVETVDDVRPLASTTTPQGVVARCRPLDTIDLRDAVAAVTPASLILLDHLEDPRNVGAIARSALAAGIGAMVISRHRSAPLSAATFKAAAGALETLAVCEVSSIANAIDDLRRGSVWTVGLDADGDRSLFGLDLLADPVGVVVGAEGAGLSRLVRERVDVVASIPLAPGVESLNASVAASLAVFEVMRSRAG